MDRTHALRVLPADSAMEGALRQLGVSPRQQAYVGHIDNLLADVATSPESESMAICLGPEAIGYYRIDPHPRSVAGRDFDVPALGLRAFFIDDHWQGQGLGTLALTALIDDLGKRFSHARLLVLSVNVSNRTATRMYQRAGFIRSGELYHGGRAGLQHLMLRPLP